MRITRLYVRNYRVYEDELELEMPAGLVGVFGPNGSGKSALLESILWTLWGRSRTAKEDVRTAGVMGDCITEVEFEHEGHLYSVRRVITGVNSTVRAEATADGLQVANGVRDVKQYVHSVLGMDDAAFRASVFAEQKQIASFSSQRPQERRDLVLRLLGITPLDVARDAARRDAKAAREDVDRLRALLGDLDELRPRAEQARAAADAAAVDRDREAAVAAGARGKADDAERSFVAVDEVRQEHDALVREGKGARAEVDRAGQQVEALAAELSGLGEAEARLAPLREAADALESLESSLELVKAVAKASAAVAALGVAGSGAGAGDEPPEPDESALVAAQEAAERSANELASVRGERKGAESALAAARAHAERSSGLSAEEDCPLCGQALGEAFEQVRAHRDAEVREAEAAVAALATRESEVSGAATGTAAALDAAASAVRAARVARDAWVESNRERAALERALAAALDALGRPVEDGELERLSAAVAAARSAAREADRLEGVLARAPVAAAAKAEAEAHLADAEGRRATLLEKVKALGFSVDKLTAAASARDEARARAVRFGEAAEAARLVAERAAMTAEVESQRLADAEAQHAALASRSDESRHLGRLADLMNAFRTNVVSTVGPRLSAQAADLFDELTDHEYDLLRVDSESYEIRIVDAGREYGMERFSGSETDLANLALRVAISEHVRFQSGGAVGLLVLDEVFGPLDDDRKERMLLALERLRARFRQILVVTHSSEIKESLGSAIFVRPTSRRRATAEVLYGS